MPVESPIIKPINKAAVHRICAGQVILDLSSAVKELVENRLDAGATSIAIALKDYGEEWFQVIDNGCGISPNNFKVIRKYASLADQVPALYGRTIYNRGEALSSLCALGSLTVETRTKNELVATYLTFDHSGLLVAERKTARQIGTTVTVKNLFSNLPVRSKEFSRNIRKEYGKLVSLLNVSIPSMARKNGFTLEEDSNAPPGCRYKLKAVPFSKNIVFGSEDVRDLISTLPDDQGDCSISGSYKLDTSDPICPPRVRAMLASRACRSSIMMGDPLGINEMRKIPEHLAELRSPWTCPHGRPTMRHLVDLTTSD